LPSVRRPAAQALHAVAPAAEAYEPTAQALQAVAAGALE
jgi:hypothetical protein